MNSTNPINPINSRKPVWGWALYDWANSAFATTVMAAFFPLFFKQFWSDGVDVNLSTARLALGNSLAGLAVALLAPVLGAVADRAGTRKRFLLLFAYLGVLATASLFLVERGRWELAVLCYAIGIVGFSGANVFYDALLPAVAAPERLDTVSSFGYALGYLGGGLLFLVNVAMAERPHWFGIPDAAKAVRLAFVSVALWWGAFTLFTLAWVPEPGVRGCGVARALAEGYRDLRGSASWLRRNPAALLFLAAYWCYIDGVDTIIRMAVDYGLSLGLPSSDLIVSLLIVQFIGFPAAIAFGRLGVRIGPRRAIYIGIAVYMAVTVWGSVMTSRAEFYGIAIVVGLVQGGVQALSRSYYARLIPADRTAEFFGFYNLLGKFATIVGPVLVGGVGLMVRGALMPDAPTAEDLVRVGHTASRWGIASILLLFAAGAALLHRIREPQGP